MLKFKLFLETTASVLLLTLSLPLLAYASSNSTGRPSAAYGGLLIAILIVYFTRKRAIGGWLLYYYISLYFGSLIETVFTFWMVDNFNPNLWEDETLYLFFLLSTIPSYIFSLLQLIFATKLLFKSKRNTKNVNQLRYILLFSAMVGIINLIIDKYCFPDAMVQDSLALIFAAIWTLYFFTSYRVKYVLAEWPEKWDYQTFQSRVKPIG